MTLHTPGVFVAVAAAYLVWLFPERAHNFVEQSLLMLRIMLLNRSLKRAQFKLYKQLQKDHRERGWPELPPFEFVPIQRRRK